MFLTLEDTCWHIYIWTDSLSLTRRGSWGTGVKIFSNGFPAYPHEVVTDNSPSSLTVGSWVAHLTPHQRYPWGPAEGQTDFTSGHLFWPYFIFHCWPPLSSLLDFEDTDTIQTTELYLAALISNEGQPPDWGLKMENGRDDTNTTDMLWTAVKAIRGARFHSHTQPASPWAYTDGWSNQPALLPDPLPPTPPPLPWSPCCGNELLSCLIISSFCWPRPSARSGFVFVCVYEHTWLQGSFWV